MINYHIANKLLDRFLSILNVNFTQADFQNLEKLVAAFLCKIPFENISKLYYLKTKNLKHIPSIELYLCGIEEYNFGGTCYSNNYYLNLLMQSLGYDVMLCGADMNNPDSHLTNVVSIDGSRYLVDAGYAAPFTKPLIIDIDKSYSVSLGRDRYQLNPPDEAGYLRLDMYRDEKLRHGYTLKPYAREFSEFNTVISNSFLPDSTFMTSILIVNFCQSSSIMINNLSLIGSQDKNSEIFTIPNKNTLIENINQEFNIPESLISTAIDGINLCGDSWS